MQAIANHDQENDIDGILSREMTRLLEDPDPALRNAASDLIGAIAMHTGYQDNLQRAMHFIFMCFKAMLILRLQDSDSAFIHPPPPLRTFMPEAFAHIAGEERLGQIEDAWLQPDQRTMRTMQIMDAIEQPLRPRGPSL